MIEGVLVAFPNIFLVLATFAEHFLDLVVKCYGLGFPLGDETCK